MILDSQNQQALESNTTTKQIDQAIQKVTDQNSKIEGQQTTANTQKTSLKSEIRLPDINKQLQQKQRQVGILPSSSKSHGNLILHTKNEIKEEIDPFITTSPLPQAAIETGEHHDAQKEVFLDYLSGDLTPKDFLAMRNFPRIYQNLPEPKKVYLQMLKSQVQGDSGSGGGGEKNQKRVSNQGENEEEPGSPASNPSSKFSDQHEEKLKVILNSKLKSVAQKQKFALNKNLKSGSSARGGGNETDNAQSMQNFSKQSANQQSSFQQMLQTRMSMVNFQNNQKQNKSSHGSNPAVINSNINRKNIQQSLRHLKQVIRQNIDHRRIQQEYLNLSGTQEEKLQQLAQIQIQQRKRNAKTSSTTKFLSNLNQLTSDYQNKLKEGEQDEGNPMQKQMYSNKQLRNISIIHELKGQDTEKQLQTLKRSQPKDEFSTQRPLYKKFFDDNADQFVQMVREPFSQQFRHNISKSDSEYQKLLKRYLYKCDVDQKRMHQKITNSSKLVEYMQTGLLEQRDQIEMRKKKPENIYLQQISDLDSFQKQNMIESLLSNQQLLMYKKKYAKVLPQEIPNRMRRAKQSYNNFSVNNNKKSMYNKTVSSKDDFGGSSARQPMTSNSSSGQKQKTNQSNHGNGNSNKNYLSPPQPIQQMPQQQQQQQGKTYSTSFHNNNINSPQINSENNQISNRNINMQMNILNQQESSNKLDQKLELQKKKGYFIIRRNQRPENNACQFDDMMREESDDSKDASMTEAILEMLYSESLMLQRQLVNNTQEGIIKKIKHLLKLEELKRNAFEANTYKLEHR